MEETWSDRDAQRLGRHAGLSRIAVSVNHAKRAEQQDEQLLRVLRQALEHALNTFESFLILHSDGLDGVEEFGLALGSENAARDFAQELFQYGRDRVDAEAVNVDESAVLQKVDEFSHVALMAGRAKNVFLEWALLVQLEKHDQKGPGNVAVFTHELHPNTEANSEKKSNLSNWHHRRR